MQITLRNKTYQAEHLTDLNALPLMSIGIDDNGQIVQDLQTMMGKLTNPETIATLARSLSAIFPSLPRELVSYSRETYNFNLTLNEVLQIVTAVCAELTLVNRKEAQTSAPGQAIALAPSEIIKGKGLVTGGDVIAPTVTVSPTDKWSRLESLRRQISALKSVEDFPGKDLQLDYLQTESDIITRELSSGESGLVASAK